MYLILFALLALFILYAVVTQYRATPADQSVVHRVWASVTAAAAVLGAIVMSWFHAGGGSP